MTRPTLGIAAAIVAAGDRLASPAARLLRAANAPLIMTFAEYAFADEDDISMAQAKVVLDQCLTQWVKLSDETDKAAASYIRDWIDQGYFREHESRLSRTDALQTTLRFAGGLAQRELSGTASHLRVVQSAVSDLTLELSETAEDRVRLLEAKREDIEREIRDVLQRGVQRMPRKVGAERMREVLRLARDLTADFYLIEDEIRRLDQETRRDMIAGGRDTGEILRRVLDGEDLLSASPAGQAFAGFHSLLADSARSTEFTSQLRALAANEAATDLTDAERLFLQHLMRELNRQSSRVIKRRGRSEEGLRAFVTAERRSDDQDVERLLSALFQVGASLHAVPGLSLRTEMPLVVLTGAARMSCLREIYCLEISTAGEAQAAEEPLGDELSDSELASFSGLDIGAIAEEMAAHVREQGPMTLNMLAARYPVELGVEEVVARMRIAAAMGAIDGGEHETLDFAEADGQRGSAQVPVMLLLPENLPPDILDLDL